MTKYAQERIWRKPDGKLVAESEISDQVRDMGSTLAYAVGDAIEDEDDEKAAGSLAGKDDPNADAPDSGGLATAAGTSKAVKSASKSAPAAKGVTVVKAAPATKTTTIGNPSGGAVASTDATPGGPSDTGSVVAGHPLTDK